MTSLVRVKAKARKSGFSIEKGRVNGRVIYTIKKRNMVYNKCNTLQGVISWLDGQS